MTEERERRSKEPRGVDKLPPKSRNEENCIQRLALWTIVTSYPWFGYS